MGGREELSSAAGRAVRRHREMSKILADRGVYSGAPVLGFIGTGARAELRTSSQRRELQWLVQHRLHGSL